MKIKNFLVIIILLFLSIFLFLTCAREEKKGFIRIKSSAPGGSWYAGATAWAKLITNNTEFIATNNPSPGLSIESIARMLNGDAQLAFISSNVAYAAYKGEGIWENPVEVRALFGIWPGVHNIIVNEDSGIKDIYDLKGKRIATYVEGDITGDSFIELLAMHGVTPENTRFYRLMKNDGTRMFIDGRVDCIIYLFGHGHANLIRITEARNVRLIFGDRKHIEPWMKRHPYYSYKRFGEEFGLEENYQFVTSYFTASLASLPEDMAYLFTKVWYENWDYLMEALPSNMPWINRKNPMEGIPIPIHPGAERFYREIGLMR
ncbi:MAG: TAXI family TRAP transporter solute-binding subunit [Spirochaetaceae bacterium]|nr:TAXI family TRAP transporter solute-binding subunit [Spirochaetaceae bacterium]